MRSPDLVTKPWDGNDGSVQSPTDWLDVSAAREFVFRIDALELSGMLSLQSAQGAQGPWTNVTNVTAATRAVVVVKSAEPGAAENLQRYVLWVLEPPGSTFLTTFQVSAAVDDLRSIRRAQRDDGATIQPYFFSVETTGVSLTRTPRTLVV